MPLMTFNQTTATTQRSPLTRHLERLDAIAMTGTARDTQPVDVNSCKGAAQPVRPSDGVVHSTDWQRMIPSSDESYVFSAHYDTRWVPSALIQIIGVTCNYDMVDVFCRQWFTDRTQPLLTRAIVEVNPESHGRKFVYPFSSFVYLFRLCIYLSVCLLIYFPIYLHVPIYLRICLSICLIKYLFI